MAGGGADTAVDNVANWGGATVDLAGGTLSAIFASAGSLATIPADREVALRGMIGENSIIVIHRIVSRLEIKRHSMSAVGGIDVVIVQIGSTITNLGHGTFGGSDSGSRPP